MRVENANSNNTLLPCTITALVTSRWDGDFLNRVFPGDLQTTIGPNPNTASAKVNFCCPHVEKREECLSSNLVDEDVSYEEELAFIEESAL